jgi:hypothetical protein
MNNFWINNKKRAIDESLKTTPDATPDWRPRPMHFKWNLVLSNSQWLRSLYNTHVTTDHSKGQLQNPKLQKITIYFKEISLLLGT